MIVKNRVSTPATAKSRNLFLKKHQNGGSFGQPVLDHEQPDMMNLSHGRVPGQMDVVTC